MATVRVNDSVTVEQVMAALRDQLPSAKVELAKNEADTLRVQSSLFARAKVRVHQTGGGTTFDVRPAPIGPIGFLVSAGWFTGRVARALRQAPQTHS